MLKSDSYPTPASSATVPVRTPANVLSVKVIGSLQIVRDGVTLSAKDFGGPKPRQILEILLINLGNPVSKDKLISLLWNGNPPAEALPTLESYVSVLRRNLQPGAGKNGVLRTTTGGYVIDRTLVDVDLARFERSVRLAHQCEPIEGLKLMQEALAFADAPLLGDELLPAWAEEERDLHAARVTEAKLFAAETATAVGAYDLAITWANQITAQDALNERAWTSLILALEASGRHTEGLQSYERCRRIMHRELGCSPGPALKAAHARLLQATADSEGELSDVLSALLLLHNQISRTGVEVPAATPAAGKSLREAGNVLNSFLRRALAAA
ncbi:hypothetical protein GCM10027404_06040 [Arthrobacter tumbae]|uniref:AfsR/SARP family transcriptional regulator n=1 Tax=Arthrobacter tumbae TaxID=163874 RepID=UPI00195A2244|nr:BTAD domain-containing putative transcriptional regulator [Arthrobacter tumbae]MBM7779953.1 DNA-binding SARP family transcriptional activator [Arthrobacter tumbae]